MPKNCLKCGAYNEENSMFCSNCGNKLETTTLDTQNKVTIYPEKTKNKKKMIIATVSIVIAISLITMGFLILFMGEEQTEKDELDYLIENITGKIEGGPAVSLQSMAGGNFQTVPSEGCIAKYYVYYDGEKIGETIQANSGKTIYDGTNCYKILGRTNIDMIIMSSEIAFVMEYTYYVDEDNSLPVAMILEYEYTKPSQIKGMSMTSQLNWDQSTGEITMTMNNPLGGESISTSMMLPEEYWGLLKTYDSLYVGYSKEINYSMSYMGETADIIMTLDVTAIEDITTIGGTFEDCYAIELQQQVSSGSLSNPVNSYMKFWVSEEGVTPKAETTMESLGIGTNGFSMIQELEGYYTTE